MIDGIENVIAEMNHYAGGKYADQWSATIRGWADRLAALPSADPVAWRWQYDDGEWSQWHRISVLPNPVPKRVEFVYHGTRHADAGGFTEDMARACRAVASRDECDAIGFEPGSTLGRHFAERAAILKAAATAIEAARSQAWNV